MPRRWRSGLVWSADGLRRRIVGLAIGLAAAGGCGSDPFYITSLAAGQLDIFLNSIPIGVAIDGGGLTEEQVDQLELILDVRDFARDTIGLKLSDSYTLFYDNSRAAHVFNLSASDKDRFRPMTWTFPLVGTIPYLGFFDAALAVRQERALIEQGLDTFSYEADAYSTLGLLPNPVRASFLERDVISLTDTVIHELLHDTVWIPGDTTFNESLATFVGRTGSLEYLGRRYGDDSMLTREALLRFQDTDRFNAFMFDLFDELDAFYRSDLDREAKIAGREAIFEAARARFLSDIAPLMNRPQHYAWVEFLPTNNAWMLANYRYNLDLALFEQVHQATGEDWPQTISLFREAAGAEDPKAFLRDRLGNDVAPSARRGTTEPLIRNLRTPCLVEEITRP